LMWTPEQGATHEAIEIQRQELHLRRRQTFCLENQHAGSGQTGLRVL
jgi:hypothetical protein